MTQQIIEGSRLSPQQRRIWKLQQRDGQHPYRAQCAVRLEGALDVGRLERALRAVIERHEILRTSFRLLPGMSVPLQVVGQGQCAWEEIDVSGREIAEQWREVWAHYAQMGEAVATGAQQRDVSREGRGGATGSELDEADEALLQVRLVKLSAVEHVLLVCAGALCADGATLRNLVRELRDEYAGSMRGDSSNGESSVKGAGSVNGEGSESEGEWEEVLQYADLAEWQNELLEAEETAAGREFWQRVMAAESGGQVQEFALASERRGDEEAFGQFSPQRLIVELREDARRGLETLLREGGARAREVLLGSWASLVWRLREQSEVVVAMAFAGRGEEALEDALGPFVKYLPVRVRLDGGLRFVELVERIKQAVAENSQWQESFSWEQLARDEDEAEETFYPVAFEYEEWGEPERAAGVVFTISEPYVCAERYTVKLSCQRLSNQLRLELHYDEQKLSQADVRRLGEEYAQALASALAQPEARVDALELVGAEERRQLLEEWNRTEREYPRDSCIQELFEQQAARTPEAVAVETPHGSLSYGELNARANRLAHFLRRQGVGSESLVGVLMERGAEMMVALLGVLKAGGAYVPLDPQYPQERIAFMLSDASVSVLLTHAGLAANVPAEGLNVIRLDEDWESINLESERNPARMGTADNLAYVIYTSGSTGRPKGVLVAHRNLVHSTYARLLYYREPVENYLLLSSFAFDSSVAGIFWTLCAGGTLSLPHDNAQQNPAQLVEWVERRRATHLLALPSLYSLILTTATDARRLASLRAVIVAGEACTAELVERHARALAGATLYNEYGPTEGTVWSSVYDCSHEPPRAVVPIGRPIPNTRLYILDKQAKPVPVGVAGELHVGGAGLARGYLNRPDLTAERFIPDAFGTEGGARLYRTGDLARYLPDGHIEFLGRIDNQVKIRGYRIEMGEIEAALSAHASVRECVVVAREDAPGEKRLAAYLTLTGQHAPTVTEFRDFLKEKLPDYMIPAVFVALDAMPLTPNGKIDRNALPAPDRARPKLAREFVAPRTPEEEALAAIWAQALGVERVGIYDNFFELGGDSIRSVQVRASAQAVGLNFSVQQLFKHQTIHDLLESLAREENRETSIDYQPFSLVAEEDLAKLPAGLEDAYPLAKLQLGMLFHSEYTSTTAAYHDITSVHLHSPLDTEALATALAQVASHHPMLRTSFDLNNFSEPLQLVHRTAHPPLTVEDLRHLTVAEQETVLEAWIEAEKGRRFDWHTPPLLRFHIHRRTDDSYQFTLSLHHAILDGWSVASMLTELYQQYFYLLGDRVEPIKPPPASTYGEFVALERSSLTSAEHRAYWSEKLSDSTITRLPHRRRQSGARELHTRVVPVPAEVSAGLKHLAQAAGVPLKSVLLAAHLRVLSVLGGQRDVVTGLVSHGRPEEVDGERVLGLFLNTLPFRLRLRGGSWIELAREVFKAEREMLPFRRYPLAELQRMVGGQPLFEVAFNFIHFHVYQTVQSFQRMQVLDGKFFEETNFPLMAHFSLDLLTSDVQLRLDFNDADFDQEQLDIIAGYYAAALSALAADPTGEYESHTLLPEAERRKLLVEWNDTRRDYPAESYLHELFEAQAERTPDAVALVFGNERLTYRELDARANQLAHYLRSLGVRPEVLVGVLMERTSEMVVALLGILKAGGAYVPLDPQYPQERIAFMLTDASVSVLLTQERLASALPAHEARVVRLDSGWAEIARQSEDKLAREVVPANTAYVIYTSGSTGKPKGVIIEHRNAGVFVQWAREVFTEEELACVLASTSICFDLSVFELFVPLSCGGRVVLALNALQLPALKERGAVTLINTVPSAMAELVRAGGVPASVQTVNLAGEPLQSNLVRQIYRLPHVERVYNLYGPSEDTTYSTYALIPKDDAGAPSIGRPIANSQAYVLDHTLRPAPAGVAGELYLGGAGLARGYLKRPELTAEKFIPDPFSSEPGARLYRTGDVARWGDDGQLEFLGRADQQVKIRGYRIELGEIEALLVRHAAVREAVVTVWEETPGDKRLVAYVVTETDDLDSGELRLWLREKLPDYMIPSVFVRLPELPLTPNGKIDRRALPRPDMHSSERRVAHVAPRDLLELQLTKIWEDVLNVESIGTRDNFFDLGGHSLLALRLVSQVERLTGQDLPLGLLFEHPTVEALAAYLRRSAGEQSATAASLVRIQPHGTRPPLFFVHSAGGHVFRYVNLARELGEDQPFYGLQAAGVVGRTPETKLEEMAARYLEEVLAVRPNGPYFLGGWSMGGVVAYEMARRLLERGERVAALILIDTRAPHPFDQLRELDESVLLAQFIYDLGLTPEELGVEWEQFTRLATDEQMNYLMTQAKKSNLMPPDLELERVRHLYQMHKINMRAMLDYVPRVAPIKATLFKANEKLMETPADAMLGWGALAGLGVEVHAIPGHHFSMIDYPHVRTLAGGIRASLDAAETA